MQARAKVQAENTDEDSEWEKFKEIRPEEITVAIFCALSYESVAVKYSLDEEFECRAKAIGPKKYVYSFGRIGDHKIVIARPHQMGTVKAAQCAATVCQQFPNVRFALMTGIGAGIPDLPQRDVRLGDVVVSIPRDGHPGVIEYDFGKYESDGQFVLKGSLDKPPPILISADGALEDDELMGRSPLRRILRTITKKPGYVRPDSGDVLFARDFHHVNKGHDCSGCEASPDRQILDRAERDNPRLPVVHRGLILSGGGVVKNPEDRDRLQRGHNEAMCFEMEAAGIMDEIPCLVVRGICDYADTHKQDGWHNYAAAVAAAYSKAVLLKVYGEDMGETMSMKETMAQLEAEMNAISSDIKDVKKITMDSKRATDDKELIDWLTSVDYGAEQSDYIKKRQPGTGQWLLSSRKFEAWSKGKGQTLFCPGIPGGGKTILTSIVIEHLTTRYQTHASISIAYFYCNFRRQYQQDVEHLLASLVKQLLQDLPVIPDNVKTLYSNHKNRRTRPSARELFEAFVSVASRYSRVFVIIDALDESQPDEDGRRRLLSAIFDLQAACQASLFATSRFIPDITKMFPENVSLEIRASKVDIQNYVEGYMETLRSFVRNDQELRSEIAAGIANAVDGMFLLAQIYLSSLDDKVTPKEVRKTLMQFRKQTPGSSEGQKREILEGAYKDAMERIQGQKSGFRKLAENVLAWITCARRPLATEELRHALALELEADIHEPDDQALPQVEDMVSVCAGLVTVDVASSIIRLVHYTTQEYFERSKEIWFPGAEAKLTNVCIRYLSFDMFDTGICREDREFQDRLLSNPLYTYAANNWGHHARKAGTLMPGVGEFLARKRKLEASSQALLVDSNMSSLVGYSSWIPRLMTPLHFAAYFGIWETASALLSVGQSQGLAPDSRDTYGRTPVTWAALNGHDAVVNMLLEAGANAEAKDKDGQTALSHAAQNGNDKVVGILVQNGAGIDSRSKKGRTPLSYGSENGHQAVVTRLLKEGAAIDAKDRDGQAALSLAAMKGHDTVVNVLLLDEGIDLESRDRDGRTPLSWAVQSGDVRVVTLLLEKSAMIDSNDKNGRTPLSWAATFGRETTSRLLVEGGANLESADKDGRTPLSWAAGNGHESVVRLLLENGAELESHDFSGQTPLAWATWNWEGDVTKTLLEKGANLYSKDKRNWTPLQHAVDHHRDKVIRELLLYGGSRQCSDPAYKTQELFLASEYGLTAVLERLLAGAVDLEQKARFDRTPLELAAGNGHTAAVKLLLEHGADVESRAGFGTPLIEAAKNGHGATVEALLDEGGADLESQVMWGKTALSWAAEEGHAQTVKLLLEKGANANSTDSLYGRTALSYAAEKGCEAVVRELLQGGASMEIRDNEYGWYPFDHAEDAKHQGVVRLLLEKGAEWKFGSKEFYRRQLVLAIKHGYTAVVESLLENGVDAQWKDPNLGWTPLSRAAQTGNDAVVRLLIKNGADPNSIDSDGLTPLSCAAETASAAVVKQLLDSGAMIDAKARNTSWTPLFHAIVYKNEATAMTLIEKGADTSLKDPGGQNLLSFAAKSGLEAVVHLFLDRSIDPGAVDEEGRTSLSYAAESGNEAIVRLLHEKAGVDLDSKDSQGRTPLSWAAQEGKASVVRYLLTKGANVEVKDAGYGRTPLSWALYSLGQYKDIYRPPLSAQEQEGYDTTVRLLLEKSAELPIRDDEYSQFQLALAAKYGDEDIVARLLSKGVGMESKALDGLTPLFWAAQNGDAAIVSQLLKAGADTEPLDNRGNTALLWASLGGYDEVVQLLLDSGADITGKSRLSDTPIGYADQRGHGNTVRLLLENGANSRAGGTEYYQYQLLMAAKYGYIDLLERLLQKDMGSQAEDGQYDELLLWAAEDGDLAVMQRLLQRHVDLDLECRDERGRTPLSWAAQYGHKRVAHELIQEGALIDSESEVRRTPLSYAAGFGNEAVVRLLLDAGASRHSRDKDGRTPMAWAIEGGHQAVVKLLEISS